MFKWARNTLRKSEAAVIVQQVLEAHAAFGPPPFNPATLANELVALVWSWKPDIFEGRLGKQPHKMSVAATALTAGLLKFSNDSDAELIVHLSLGAVLLDLLNNEPFYDLAGPDRWLIDRANEAYTLLTEKRRPAQDALLGSLGI